MIERFPFVLVMAGSMICKKFFWFLDFKTNWEISSKTFSEAILTLLPHFFNSEEHFLYLRILLADFLTTCKSSFFIGKHVLVSLLTSVIENTSSEEQKPSEEKLTTSPTEFTLN